MICIRDDALRCASEVVVKGIECGEERLFCLTFFGLLMTRI